MSEIIHSKLEKYLLHTNVHRKKNNIFNTTETPFSPLLSQVKYIEQFHHIFSSPLGDPDFEKISVSDVLNLRGVS